MFQDATHLYLLTELLQGGELHSLLARQPGKRLPQEQAVFYGAIVAAALEHLHERHYVYRDIKPENLLVDARGYLRLVDLGFAKEVLGNTYSSLLTPHSSLLTPHSSLLTPYCSPTRSTASGATPTSTSSQACSRYS